MFEKVKGLSKKQKLLIAAAVTVLAVGGVSGAVYGSQSQKKVSEAQAVIDTEQGNLKAMRQTLEGLLDADDKEYLGQDVPTDIVEAMQKEFDHTMKTVQSLSVYTEKLNVRLLTSEEQACKDLLETIEHKISAQEAVNKLFQSKDKAVALNGSKVVKDLAIADDLKIEAIQTVKKDYVQDQKESSFTKTLSELVTNAENQLKQIETAKTAVSKVYKDNKVISTEFKLYDSAKSETDKIKNTKAQKTLADQLVKVKADIDKKAKDETEKAKQAEEQKQAAQTNEAAAAQANEQQAQEATNAATTGQATANENAANTDSYTDNGSTYTGNQGGYTPSTSGGTSGGGYTPPATGGGDQGGTTPTQPVQPTEPEVPSGPPAGWIVPPYPIGSAELGGWIYDNGYFGYDASDGYIRPY